MERFVLICTHPTQFTGYAKVAYNILRGFGNMYPNSAISCYGFHKQTVFRTCEDLPSNIILHDAVYTNDDKFGLQGIRTFIKLTQPTTILIYNDPIVINAFIDVIVPIMPTECRLCAYIDTVYPASNKKLREQVSKRCHKVFVFASCWACEMPGSHVVHHGVNDANIKEICQNESRRLLGLPPPGERVIMLNINKNGPRKRYDVLIQALVLHLKQVPKSKIMLLIGTECVGAWDLQELYDQESKRHGNTIEFSKVVTFVNNPHTLTDSDINILYNVSDFGINTCDGEGFGLCNAEHALVGKPQILSNIPIFRELYGDAAKYADAVCEYYSDYQRDSAGGLATICSSQHFADLIGIYEADAHQRIADGKAVQAVISKYTWEASMKKFNAVL